MKLQEVLLGAAGIIDFPESIDGIDDATLMSHLVFHRLVGSFVERTKQAEPKWLTNELKYKIIILQQQIEASVAARIRETAALASLVHEPLIVIKGFSSYAILNTSECITYSGDIDVFAADADLLMQTLIELGYKQHASKVMHEFATAYLEGASVFDIHNFYPVWSFRREVGEDDFIPALHLGKWFRTYDVYPRLLNKITYNDLRINSMPGIAAGTKDLFLPKPSMAVLIGCANMLNDYINSEHFKKQGRLRLGDLLEIRRLMDHNDFDSLLFWRLVDRFEAYDSLRYVGYMYSSFFGDDLFGLAEESMRFPLRLWDGFWVAPNLSLETTLSRERASEDIIKELGFNEVRIADKTVYSTSDNEESDLALERLMVAHKELPIRISWNYSCNSLVLELHILRDLDDKRADLIRLDLGDKYCEWKACCRGNIIRLETLGDCLDFGSETVISQSAIGYRLRLRFPSSTDFRERYIILAVIRIKASLQIGDEIEPIEGTMIPLQLV